MPSGPKNIVITTQQREYSNDINRLQDLGVKAWAEVLRYAYNVQADDDVNSGVVTEFVTLTTPMSADIVNGLMVQPDVGTLNLGVTPGVLLGISPDSDNDASVYKVVTDSGFAIGGLHMAAGGSGTRIDIIEVQVGPQVQVETAVKDVYNVALSSFASTTVTAAMASNCTGTGNIRIRSGITGGAFPGAVIGWVPLAVVSVPAGATSNDQMTFWDVRPLLAERAFGMMNIVSERPIIRDVMFNADDVTNLSGKIECILNTRRIGGKIRTGVPGADGGAHIDITNANNQESGFVTTTGNPWHLYFCTPFGLPRWARYADAFVSVPRLPRNPRGIPIVSRTASDSYGRPSAAITLPTSIGLGTGAQVQTNEAVCPIAGVVGSGIYATARSGMGNAIYLGFETSTTFATSPASGIASFVLVPGQSYPGNAREIFIDVAVQATSASAGQIVSLSIIGQSASSTNTFLIGGPVLNKPANGTVYNLRFSGWVPISSVYPVPSLPGTIVIQASVPQIIGDSATSATLNIRGWKLG